MEKVSRRDFIKTGTIATLGMTVFSAKTVSCRRRDEKTGQSRSYWYRKQGNQVM